VLYPHLTTLASFAKLNVCACALTLPPAQQAGSSGPRGVRGRHSAAMVLMDKAAGAVTAAQAAYDRAATERDATVAAAVLEGYVGEEVRGHCAALAVARPWASLHRVPCACLVGVDSSIAMYRTSHTGPMALRGSAYLSMLRSPTL
jgi:hypothetical protein